MNYLSKRSLCATAILAIAINATSVNAMSFFNKNSQLLDTTDSIQFEVDTVNAMPVIEDQPTPAVQNSIELPDKLNTISDSLENENDVKVYSFTAARGQDVNLLSLHSPSANNLWTFEVNRNNTWNIANLLTPKSIINLNPGETVLLRISHNKKQTFKANSKFTVEFGSRPYRASHTVTSDASNLPLYWGTTQSYKFIHWSVILVDSTGHPVEGATATMKFTQREGHQAFPGEHNLVSGATGQASGSISLGECTGAKTSDPFYLSSGKYRYKWTVSYNTGDWYMSIRGNDQTGVGSAHGQTVTYAHICNQRMIR